MNHCGATLPIRAGLVIDIPTGTAHRVSAATPVTFLEVSTPEVDDAVRLLDDYGRAASAPKTAH